MSRNQNKKTRAAEDKPAGAVVLNPALTPADRVFLKFGRPGAKLVHQLIAVLLGTAVLFFDYLLVMYTAVSVLPNIAALLQQGTGVTLEMRPDTVIAGWLVPLLFLTAVVLVAEVFLMRRLWRWTRDLSRRVGASLFRLDDKTEKSAPRAGKVSRLPRPTKITAVS